MNKFKMPKQIVIFGRKFKVKEVSHITFEGHEAAGLCDLEKKIILIKKDMPDEERFVTLCHEASHVFLFLTGKEQTMTHSEVETFCQLNANFILDFIRSIK